MGLLQATLGTPAPHGDYGYTPRRLPILLQCLLRLPDGDANTVVERAADDTPGLPYVPHPTSWDIRGWWETNALNGPTWSLMWEYIANVLYALFIRRFSKLALGIFVGLSACLTLDVTLNIDTFGLLSSRGEAAYTLIGGWSLTPGQLYIGISRLLYPFFMGLLLSRIGKLVKVKRGFYWCSLLVTVILVMPRIRRDQPMDERRLRSRKRARPLSADSGYGSRQQRHGQAFRSPLQIPGRTILSAVHHTLPADIHADSLGTE